LAGERSPLDTPVQYLKGIGPRRAALLGKVGVETVGQLLFFVPRRYIDRSETRAIRDLRPGDEATVIGRVVAAGAQRTRRFQSMVAAIVRDQSGTIEAVWFNRPDLRDRFRPNQEMLLSGTVSAYRGRQMVNPLFEVGDETGEFSFANTVIPVYPLTEGLSVWTIRRAVRTALDRLAGRVPETLTDATLRQYDYPGIGEALETMHFPKSAAEGLRSRERLVYDELFYFELLLALRKRATAEVTKAEPLSGTGLLTRRFLAGLGFSLTRAQQQVIAEIAQDLARERCMNRLLQGDVGSGKTVVALHAMLVAVECGAQAALMAPTEILAEQHFNNWDRVLAGLGVKAVLVTGSRRAVERRAAAEALASGAAQMAFGTHALIEQGVEFARLGLAVVDEQHRFGVLQRAALIAKGLNPDFLVMTATPIPRTLMMTLYGDLDVSVIGEKPPGRKAVQTRVVPEARRSEVYAAVERRLGAGEQAFVVCPLIDESEKLDLASAVRTFGQVEAALPGRKVGLVHGRLKPVERAAMMERFRSGGIDVLVATSVIEVGVDVPNATVMIVEHAERFGLAQLHQLRGRIGRSDRQSYCLLLTAAEAEFGVGERLRYFARTADGFKVAERDMELRGPGELLGTRQHGLPDLRIADVARDRQALVHARRDAFRLIELDPLLSRPENELIKQTILGRYAGRAELMRVG
jgi:ATP-dependent DNA helicase RecG